MIRPNIPVLTQGQVALLNLEQQNRASVWYCNLVYLHQGQTVGLNKKLHKTA